MGTYTPTLRLYKPAPDEVVVVEQQVNGNWRIGDTNLKPLLEYKYTTEQNISVLGALPRWRYHKTYSNSIFAWSGTTFFFQDTTAAVYPWVNASALCGGGWSAHPDLPPYYRIVQTPGTVTTQIEWMGSVWMGGAAIPANTPYGGVIALPAATVPVITKLFTCHAGDTAAGYSIARVGFSSAGSDIGIQRYGSAPISANENRVDLGGIKYNIQALA
jgi:hypothetical protein